MASIEQMINDLIEREGGFVDNPSDKGGPTTYGITEAVARENGYAGPMRDLPMGFAREVYRKRYLTDPGYDKVYALSQRIAEEMFDTGVNMGVGLPGKWLQRILNALNRQQKDYRDIVVDGLIGSGTTTALRAYLNVRGAVGEVEILRLLNCLQGARYLEITEAREANEQFLFGWAMSRLIAP